MEAARFMDAHHESRSAIDSNSSLEPPHHDDEEQLTERIQALAQELQDMILDHTIVAGLENAKDKSPTNKILLTSRYCSPWQLHLNRRTRKLVAHQYFANSVFQLPNATCYARGRPTLEAWLINIDPLYFGLITKIRLDCRKAKMSCMDKLCIAVDDVEGCGDAVENACGYELDESIFQIVTNPVFKKRVGQKKDTGEYTVNQARELGNSPWIHPAYVDRLN